eukprot:NODE_5975_length_539_cov_551.477273.p4 GENE.NODE_5975_length_539_cov_551.477273~~NODE_5975_length_539_cov_551.477273.p4  ORF type:complete len:68 (-),score=36.03 NODE_5975_length_539_cov_551.477273:31-234(-)
MNGGQSAECVPVHMQGRVHPQPRKEAEQDQRNQRCNDDACLMECSPENDFKYYAKKKKKKKKKKRRR